MRHSKNYTIPGTADLRAMALMTPEYMNKALIPNIFVCEELINPQACKHFRDLFLLEQPYSLNHCSATTREATPEIMDEMRVITNYIRTINALCWQYVLNVESNAWMQTYEEEDSYQLHMDAAPGQSRKLTCILLLSDPENYTGGKLSFHYEKKPKVIDQPIGTVVIFPSWVMHEVSKLYSGCRQSINFGFWGPPLR